jgi:hypothetical protein
MDRVLSLPNELVLADQATLFDEVIEVNGQAGTCGLRAWQLASELRRRRGIPASTLTTSWDFVARLREQAEAASERRKTPVDISWIADLKDQPVPP